jgi:hypothetical protein
MSVEALDALFDASTHQLARRAAPRHLRARVEVEERAQDKGALMHARMRQRQSCRGERRVAVQEEVKIQGAWRAGKRSRAALACLDRLQGFEE